MRRLVDLLAVLKQQHRSVGPSPDLESSPTQHVHRSLSDQMLLMPRFDTKAGVNLAQSVFVTNMIFAAVGPDLVPKILTVDSSADAQCKETSMDPMDVFSTARPDLLLIRWRAFLDTCLFGCVHFQLRYEASTSLSSPARVSIV